MTPLAPSQALTEACTHHDIESNLNVTLKEDANRKKTHTKLDFKKWTAALKLLDDHDKHVNDKRKLWEMIVKNRMVHLELFCGHSIC
jgi:hypothetical protein